MKAFRFENRITGKKIVIAANNFGQAVNDLYATLGREKAATYKFSKMI